MIEFFQNYAGLLAFIVIIADRVADITKTNVDNTLVEMIYKLSRAVGLRLREKVQDDEVPSG